MAAQRAGCKVVLAEELRRGAWFTGQVWPAFGYCRVSVHRSLGGAAIAGGGHGVLGERPALVSIMRAVGDPPSSRRR